MGSALRPSELVTAQSLGVYAPIYKVRHFFLGSKLEVRKCTDEGFAAGILRRAEQFLGGKREVLPVYFIQACYIEHVLKGTVDYAGIVRHHGNSREELSKDSADANGKAAVEQKGHGTATPDDNCGAKVTRDTVPEGKRDTVPEGKRDTVPEGKIDTAPEGKQDTVPEGKRDTVPEGKINTAPEGKQDTVPEGKLDTAPEGNPEKLQGRWKQKLKCNKSTSAPTRRARDLSRLAPVCKVKSLFGDSVKNSRFNLDFCTDDVFSSLVARRGEEFLGKKFIRRVIPAYFVQACYVEHVLRRNVEYVGVIRSVDQEYARIKLMKERTRAKQAENSNSGENDVKQEEENEDELWRPSRQDLSCAAPIVNILPVFPGEGSKARGKTYVFDATKCSNSGFAVLLERVVREFVPGVELTQVPAYVVQTCYLEHFCGRKVDIPTTIDNARSKRRSWRR